MTDTNTMQDAETAPARRARVAVLGEFSAGKSTFINLITGGRTLRTQVTATQMPAVWMTYGSGTPYRVNLDGSESPIDLNDLSDISVTDTAYIRVFMKTPILEICDLIDTPGNSDPNIAPIAWERIAAIADVAIWCSPSTQAWRQSEAAAWADMPEALREKSVLLLTRADKLTSQSDREKVLRRVKGEAGHLFGSVHMGSLLNLHTVQAALRDVVTLCRQVDASQTPGVMDTAQILRSMAVADEADGTVASETDADLAFAEAEAAVTETAEYSPEEDEASEAGFATTLWIQITDGLPPDDPDALENAFSRFLTRIDNEIVTLREAASIAKVG